MKTKMNIYTVVTLITVFYGFSAFSGKPGSQPPPLTMERGGAVAFTIGNKGYVGTGGYQNDMWMYDPATNAWTQKASLGKTGRQYAVGFSIGNMGYLGLGMMKDAQGYGWAVHDFYEYDPARNAWRARAIFGGGSRAYATGFSIGTTGYVGTGFSNVYDPDQRNGFSDFWKFEPARNRWTRIADFPGVPRRGATSFVINEKAIVGTGSYGFWNYTNGPEMFRDMYEYDPASGTWAQVADFPIPCEGAAAFSIEGYGYVGSGTVNDTLYTDPLHIAPYGKPEFYEYSAGEGGGTWTRIADLPEFDRRYPTAFAIGSTGYAGTGFGFKDFYAYDRVESVWRRIADLGSGSGNLKYDEAPEAIDEQPSLTVFPNPCSDHCVISLDQISGSNVTIQVRDITGRLVSTVFSGFLDSGSHQFKWNDPGKGSAVYFVIVRSEAEYKVIKLIVQ